MLGELLSMVVMALQASSSLEAALGLSAFGSLLTAGKPDQSNSTFIPHGTTSQHTDKFPLINT